MDKRDCLCTEDEALPLLSECPLHTAMRQLVEAAMQQHVLHAMGEVLPRPELMAAMEGWIALQRVTQQRVCPATRQVVLHPEEVEITLDALFAALPTYATSPQLRSWLRRALVICAAQSQAAGCPLTGELLEEVLRQGDCQLPA